MIPGGATILVVDDEPTSLLMMQAALQKAGYEVVMTSDARRALQLAEERQPDVMVVDILMPDMSGWELIDAIRARPRFDALPVIVLSALAAPADRVRALRAGAEDFIVKPFDAEELAARVAAHLAHHGRGASALHGRLDVQPIGEVVQSLENNRKSGELHVDSGGRSGVIRVRDGRAVGAKWDGTAQSVAIESILELRRGEFRFTPSEVELVPGEQPLSFLPLLMETARVADELEARREHLPDASVPLAVRAELRTLPEALESLPFDDVHAYLEEHPGATLGQLEAQRFAAPGTVRLTVAVLFESGIAAVAEKPARLVGELPDPLGDELDELFRGAEANGLTAAKLEVRFLVEEQGWDGLASILLDIPDDLLPPDQHSTQGAIYVARHGELHLRHSGRRLVLTFSRVDHHGGLERAQGVVLWLGGGTVDVAGVVPGSAAIDAGAVRLCVAPDGMLRRQVRKVLDEASGWLCLDHHPRTLLELLAVLRFPSASGRREAVA